MASTSYDPHTESEIERALDDRNASPKLRKAAWETVIVESGIHNLPGGDRDSEGAYQQRPSQGWKNATDPYKGTLDFLDAAEPIAHKYGTAGALAQAVQRSAYPERYQQQSAAADALLGRGGSSSGPPASAGHGSASAGTTSLQQPAPSLLGQLGGSGVDFAGLLGALASQQPAAQQMSAPLQAPSFASAPQLPGGFAPLSPLAPVAKAPSTVDQGLGLLASLTGQQGTDLGQGVASSQTAQDTPPAAGVPAGQSAGGALPAGVVLSPHARPGSPVVSSKQTVGGLHDTEGLAGYPAHDYFSPAGSHVVAPVSGTIVKLSGHDPAQGPTNGPHGPLGWSVYIKTAGGKTYFLTHLGSRNVKDGETVRQGQIIGTVADYDKYGTPSHVHQGVNG